MLKLYLWWFTSYGKGQKFLEMQVKSHGQGHKVIDLSVIWKGYISWVYMPSLKSLSLSLQK